MIRIQPVAIGFNEYANGVQLKIGSYTLGSNDGCTVKVQFFIDTNLKAEKTINIPTNLVDNWTEDQGIIDYAIATLGLTILPPQSPVM